MFVLWYSPHVDGGYYCLVVSPECGIHTVSEWCIRYVSVPVHTFLFFEFVCCMLSTEYKERYYVNVNPPER